MWGSLIKLLIVFPVVIILLLVCLKMMQNISSPTIRNKKMKVIEQLRLSPKTNLSIVKVGGEYLVIACNDEQIQVISKLSEEEMQTKQEEEMLDLKKWAGGWKRG